MRFYYKTMHNYKCSDRINPTFIERISKVNVLLGENNTGKSRFLRNLFSDHYQSSLYFYLVSLLEVNIKTDNDIRQFNKYIQTSFSRFFGKPTEFKNYLITEDMTNQQIICNIQKVKEELFKYVYASGDINSSLKNFLQNDLYKYFNIRITKFFDIDDNFLLYFPVNRTFKNLLYYKDSFHFSRQHNFKEFNLDNIRKAFIEDVSILEELDYDDVIKHKFLDDYFKGNKNFSHFGYESTRKTYTYFGATRTSLYNRFSRDESIFTGGSLFYTIKSILLGTVENRKRYEEFQIFLSENFFFNERINIIPNEKEKIVKIKIGNQPERKISEIGDGIQQIILLLLPLYMRKEKVTMAFIEEPEVFLHPRMQRDLINIMIDEFPNTLFFITSHSSNFLDVLIEKDECSIYKFTHKNKEFNVSESESSQLEVLKSLGIQPSSLFISNCTIWVEGITDLLYIRRFIDMYKESNEFKYAEDKHYSIQTYGGSNFKNFNFDEFTIQLNKFNVSGVSNNVLIISDADDKDNMKSKELSEKYGSKYFELSCRTVDNTISQRILEDVMNDILGTNLNFKIKSVSYMNHNKKMGKYLNEHINPMLIKNSENERVFTNLNNNLKTEYKHKLVQSFNKESRKYQYKDLSAPARKLTERIMEFIHSSNQ